MARIITGLDVGTSTVTTIVGKKEKNGSLEVIGVAVEPAEGIRRGVVVDVEDATRAIRHSVLEASRAAQVPIKSAILSVSGSYIHAGSSRGVVAVSRADGEISEDDVRRVFAAAETFIPKNLNRDILHIIPKEFKVDNEIGIKDPLGMNGVRLEVDTLVLETQMHTLKTLFKCVDTAGIKREGVVFAPIAAADAVLTKRQKELGVILVDIGAGTADFVVFEEGRLIHAGSIPIGGNLITNDIAIGFQTMVDVAEKIKLEHGIAVPELVQKKEQIQLADFALDEKTMFPRRDLAEIIEARLKDLFELLHRELKKINRSQLLPAGVVLVGGGARMPGIEEIAKRELHLPVTIGVPSGFGNLPFDDESAIQLATSLGLLRWGVGENHHSTMLGGVIQESPTVLKRFLKLFLP